MGIVAPVVESRYQQALCPALSTTVRAGPAPWVVEAILFVVHAISVPWFESRSQYL
jgi:hypothetical protein